MRVWRVQWWVRLVLIAFWALMACQLYWDYGFVAAGEMDPAEIRDGWLFVVAFALAIWALTFRPYIAVEPDRVIIQGALRRRVFAKTALVEVAPTAWGLRFVDSVGLSFTSFICQDTGARNAPRWRDVAEAALGERPAPRRGLDPLPSVFADAAFRARLLDVSSDLEETSLEEDASVWRMRRTATGTALELEDWSGMILVTFGDGDHVIEAVDDVELARLLAAFGRGELMARYWRWGVLSGCFLVDAEGWSPQASRSETRFDRWIERRPAYKVESVPVR